MSQQSAAGPVPWRVGDAIVLYLTTLVGLALVILSWYEVSGTSRLSRQVGWANVGVLGIIVAGTGNVLWLLSGRRAVGSRRARLLADEPESAPPPPTADAPATKADADTLVATARMTRYHRADCLLVTGKRVTAANRANHEGKGRRPCGVCEP